MSLLSNIKRASVRLVNSAYWLTKSSEKLLFIKSGTIQHFGKNIPFNLGDDLNYYLLREITNKTIVNTKDTYINANNFLVIGSIIEKYCDSSSVIWGAGAMYGDVILNKKPLLVKAVRGRLTQKYLVNQGIDCPNVYGDPALLLPFVYAPQKEKKYRLGIIPHYVDKDNEVIIMLNQRIRNSIVINMVNYSNWRNVIDTILECEMIMSSSLHGIIISDAYGVPNIWFSASNNIRGGEYKFLDYFSSVAREQDCVQVHEKGIDYEDILHLVSSYKPIEFDALQLARSCPFELKSDFIDRIQSFQE